MLETRRRDTTLQHSTESITIILKRDTEQERIKEWGLTLDNDIILKVQKLSIAAKKGLQPQDRILKTRNHHQNANTQKRTPLIPTLHTLLSTLHTTNYNDHPTEKNDMDRTPQKKWPNYRE